MSIKLRLLIPIVVIALGIALVAYFGSRAVTSFREIRYIQQQGLDRGTASVDAIRPWMTLRFVAVAYAVPAEYLYSELGIPYEERDANRPLGRLNGQYHFDPPSSPNSLPIIEKIKTAITTYRANPVSVGLRDVRPWMSIRYIANSSGVPETYIFTQIGIPATNNESKPLDMLSDQLHYKGGPPALTDAVKQALAAYQGQP